MPRYITPVFAGLLVALSGFHTASAQTSAVAHLAVQSGNGQVVCTLSGTEQTFAPIVVKATDIHGNPVAGATVTWVVTSTNGNMVLASASTVTGGDGTSTNQPSQVVLQNYSTTAVPYLLATIQATSNNNSVTFTENQALIDQGAAVCVISANPPTFQGAALNQATLSEPTGTVLNTPIQIRVGGVGVTSNGVPNVSVRILNAQSSPTLSCANVGGYADPGSVLSDSFGNASCYPVFSGSGTGSFYVIIGGVPGTSVSTATYLQAYPNIQTESGFTFTSIAGAPAAVQIVSGNNQIGGVGQVLNPLVARLVDANGNAVQGATLVWSVVPAGAVGLSVSSNCVAAAGGLVDCTTDQNGEATVDGTLNSLAAAGVQVTVALQGNPSLSVTFQLTLASAITALNKISGDNQTAQTNSNFAQPLVVRVLNASGPLANYPVQFQVTGPVTLTSTNNGIVGTDANGNAIVTVKAGGVAGTATVTAVVGILNQSFTLTITTSPTGPTPNAISIASGNNQSAPFNTTFASPLVVQVNYNNNGTITPISGVPVSFSTTGPISISTGTVTTGSNGQASLTVSAAAASGAATVTASISGGYSQTFNLTVLPPGPTISAGSFLNAASRQVGAISPCSLATISAAGLTPDGISDLTPAPLYGRWPISVHNLSVTFNNIPAPIRNITMGATLPEVTLQVPCEVTPGGSVTVTVSVGGGSATTALNVQTVSPGIIQNVQSDGVTRAVVVRDDGSFADIGTQFPNPARRAENIRLYVTGMGPTIPAIGTDSVQNPNADLVGRDAVIAGSVQVGLVGYAGGGLQVVMARQAPDLIGVYEIEVALPADAPTGNSVQITVGIVPAGSSANTPAVSSLPALIAIE